MDMNDDMIREGTIRTERLCIRRVRAGDWEAIRAIWAEAAKTPYARYDRPNDLSDEAVRQRIARWASAADSAEHRFYAVCLEEKPIGYAAFNRRDAGYEIGYCFHPAYHGNGYAKESLSALLDALKAEGPARITAGTALANRPSVKLLLSLGFTQTGTEKVSFYRDSAGNDIVFDGGLFMLQL